MENFVEIKAVENEKKSSECRSREGWKKDKGISTFTREVELTNPKVHSPSMFSPMLTLVTQKGLYEVIYEENNLSMCTQLLLLPSEGTKPQVILLRWRR